MGIIYSYKVCSIWQWRPNSGIQHMEYHDHSAAFCVYLILLQMKKLWYSIGIKTDKAFGERLNIHCSHRIITMNNSLLRGDCVKSGPSNANRHVVTFRKTFVNIGNLIPISIFLQKFQSRVQCCERRKLKQLSRKPLPVETVMQMKL